MTETQAEAVYWYAVDRLGWPYDGNGPWGHAGDYVRIRVPEEIHETFDGAKEAAVRKEGFSLADLGVLCDWLEDNRERLHRMNPEHADAVDRVIARFRDEWSNLTQGTELQWTKRI